MKQSAAIDTSPLAPPILLESPQAIPEENTGMRPQHVILLALTMGACGGDGKPPTEPELPVATAMTLSTTSVSLSSLGETVQVSATVLDQFGTMMAGATVQWASSDDEVAAVSSSGLVTAVANGSAMLTVTSGSVTAAVSVSVVQAVASLVLTPDTFAFTSLGDTLRFEAWAADGGGSVVVDPVLTWRSSDPTIATVDSLGLITAIANGSTTLEVFSGATTATASVTVAQLASVLVLAPDTLTLSYFGDSARIAASVRDAGGNAIADEPLSWMSSDPTTATVDSTGLVTAIKNGAVTITVTGGRQSESVAVAVSQVAASIALSSDTLVFTSLGDSATVTAAVLDAGGTAMEGATLIWDDSGAPFVSVVSGSVVSVANGIGSIQVMLPTSSDQITATVYVEVVQVPASVALSPGSATLTSLSDTVRMTTVVYDARGSEISPDDPLVVSRWAGLVGPVSSNESVVAVPEGFDVLATAVGNGSATIKVETGYPLVTDSSVITVLQQAASITLSKASLVFTSLGDTARIEAVVRDAGGTAIENSPVTWMSSDSTIATVDSIGLVTAVASGSVTITAASGPATSEASATVDTSRIAFPSNRDIDFDIYVMNAYGSDVVRLTNNTALDFDPAWSPDGSKIAFISDRDGNWELYGMDADGSNQVRLTNDFTEDSGPTWSPDGSKIAFRSTRDGNSEIYAMDADGSNPVRLTNDPNSDREPSWSPDGSTIAFSSTRDGDGDFDIYVMDADGSNPVRLTNNAAEDRTPTWSPDGSRIAFSSNRDGNYEIYVMNADGSNPVRLTSNTAEDQEPSWSPDGLRIAFFSDRDGNLEVYVMNADGSNPVRFTRNAATDGAPSWSR